MLMFPSRSPPDGRRDYATDEVSMRRRSISRDRDLLCFTLIGHWQSHHSHTIPLARVDLVVLGVTRS